jgi:hypothetical protein
MGGFKKHPVIRHKARERQPSGAGHFNQFEREQRFSGSREPADQGGAPTDKHGGSMDGGSRRRH